MEYLQYFQEFQMQFLFLALVLNLVINGIPSIHNPVEYNGIDFRLCFKPCYKWNTFNTLRHRTNRVTNDGFKPCYKWNTFNTFREETKKLFEKLAF